jgi:recombination protein RecA
VTTLKDATGRAIGNHVRVKVVKNKVAPPFAEAEFDILFARGIYWTGSVLDVAMEQGIVEKRGSWLSFDGLQVGQGRDAAAEQVGKDPELEKKIVERVMAKVAQGGVAAKPE